MRFRLQQKRLQKLRCSQRCEISGRADDDLCRAAQGQGDVDEKQKAIFERGECRLAVMGCTDGQALAV